MRERAWEKTNHLGGKLFWICGALALISLVAPIDMRLWIVLLPVIFAAVCVYIYSIYLYRMTKRAHAKGTGAVKKSRMAKMKKGKR